LASKLEKKMTDRLDALVVRESRDGKTYFTKIGAAFPNRNGEGYTLVLSALPLTSSDGECRVLLKPPQDQQQGQRGGGYDRRDSGSGYERRGQSAQGRADPQRPLDDEVPF
jgi:hypothetical protein